MQEKADSPLPSHVVAEARGIPERFLLKVLKPLVSSGVLRSVKGMSQKDLDFLLTRKPTPLARS